MSPHAARNDSPLVPGPDRSPERIAAEAQVVAELDAWRAAAIPDPSVPLDAEELARLVRSCFDTLGIDAAVGADFSVHTVHYYRRKDILDAPSGRTSAARYDVRHVWQAAGARLAGSLGLVTLAEARRVMRGADERALVGFVAARVVDAHARVLMRRAARLAHARSVAEPNAHPFPTTSLRGTEGRARPLPGVHTAASIPHGRADLAAQAASGPATRGLMVDAPIVTRSATPALIIPLAGDALCILPATHPAHSSVASARQLVRELTQALGLPPDARESGEREEREV